MLPYGCLRKREVRNCRGLAKAQGSTAGSCGDSIKKKEITKTKEGSICLEPKQTTDLDHTRK